MLSIQWLDRGREAQCPPDPAYPDGKDVDISFGAKACETRLPFPAPRCGVWIVTCSDCGLSVGFTAAGRVDDPRRVRVPCKRNITSVERAALSTRM